MREYFPEPKSLGGRVKVELNLSNYATKTNLKNGKGVDTSIFAKKVNLANLKSNVDKSDIDKFENVSTNLTNLKIKVKKLDVDKLVPVPADLSKLCDAVKNCVENKIPNVSNLPKKLTKTQKLVKLKIKLLLIMNMINILLLQNLIS